MGQIILPAAEGKSQLVYCVIQIPAITGNVFITATWNYKFKNKNKNENVTVKSFLAFCEKDAKPACHVGKSRFKTGSYVQVHCRAPCPFQPFFRNLKWPFHHDFFLRFESSYTCTTQYGGSFHRFSLTRLKGQFLMSDSDSESETFLWYLPLTLWSFLMVLWSFSLSLSLTLSVNGP